MGDRHLLRSAPTTCERTRKIRYASRRDARRVLHRHQRDGVGGSPLTATRVYLCPHCEGWHLTSQKQPWSRSRKEQR